MTPTLPLTGGCQCGAVRFACDAEPVHVHVCHCRMCQKAVGQPFAVICPVDKPAFRVTRGEMAWFHSSAVARRGFCAACGTPMIFDYPHADDIGVMAGAFDTPDAVPPVAQAGTESRLAWLHDLGALPGGATYARDPEGLLPRIAASNRQHPDHDTGMRADDVLWFWALAEAEGWEVCLDGGWAVDALLGEETRAHRDLDIALPATHVPALRATLATEGFHEVSRDDSWAHNFVLRDGRGREIDVHSYIHDAEGEPVGGVPYAAAMLSGAGEIAGQPVRCVPPGTLVAFHTGYAADRQDYADVRRLCDRFGLALPEGYRRFEDG